MEWLIKCYIGSFKVREYGVCINFYIGYNVYFFEYFESINGYLGYK